MSVAPAIKADDIGPIEWVNRLTFIAHSSADQRLEEGDHVLVNLDGENLEVERESLVTKPFSSASAQGSNIMERAASANSSERGKNSAVRFLHLFDTFGVSIY